jgi:ADP-ribose pyrophosphatase
MAPAGRRAGDYNRRMIPEALRNTPCVFHGVRFDVHALELPGRDGQKVRREVVVHPGAVVILPLLDPETVVLIRNRRFAVDQTLWELPAGTLEAPPETPLSCARRELIEETGYEAAIITELTAFYASPGILTEVMHAFVATDLKPVGQDLDESEQITAHPKPWAEVLAMVRSGEIRDGKTIATLLYYRTFAAAASR